MMPFLRLLVLIVVLALGISPTSAQNNCRSAAADAAAMLDQAREALAGGDSARADALIAEARARLSEGCPNVAPPDMPTAAPAPEAAQAGNFTINAPHVTADQSLFFLRVAHTGIDSGPLDFYLPALGTEPLVANLSYGEATGLIAVPTGSYRIVARPAGSGPDGAALYTLNWNFQGNSTWVVTAAGLTQTLAFIVEPVTIIRTPLNGKARVRVVNWVAAAERMSVTSDAGVKFADRIGWVGIQDREVEPGPHTLRITGASGAAYGDPQTFEFAADTVYTLLLAGGKDGDPPVGFMPLVTPQDQTRVRFVNNRGDAVDIHARPGNALIAANVAPEAATDWIALPSTAATFVAYAPGTGPTGQEKASFATQLRPGRDITLALRPNGQIVIQEVALTPAQQP